MVFCSTRKIGLTGFFCKHKTLKNMENMYFGKYFTYFASKQMAQFGLSCSWKRWLLFWGSEREGGGGGRGFDWWQIIWVKPGLVFKISFFPLKHKINDFCRYRFHQDQYSQWCRGWHEAQPLLSIMLASFPPPILTYPLLPEEKCKSVVLCPCMYLCIWNHELEKVSEQPLIWLVSNCISKVASSFLHVY